MTDEKLAAVEKFKAKQKENSKKAREAQVSRDRRLERTQEMNRRHEAWLAGARNVRLAEEAKAQAAREHRALAIAKDLSLQPVVHEVALMARIKRYTQQEPQVVRDEYPLHAYLGWTKEQFEHWHDTKELPKP